MFTWTIVEGVFFKHLLTLLNAIMLTNRLDKKIVDSKNKCIMCVKRDCLTFKMIIDINESSGSSVEHNWLARLCLYKNTLDKYIVENECMISFDIKDMLSMCTNLKKKDCIELRLEDSSANTLSLVIHRNNATTLTEIIKCPVEFIDMSKDLNFDELVTSTLFIPTSTTINLTRLATIKSEIGNKRDLLGVKIRGGQITFTTKKKSLYPIEIIYSDDSATGETETDLSVDFKISGYIINILLKLHNLAPSVLVHRMSDSMRQERQCGDDWIGLSSSTIAIGNKNVATVNTNKFDFFFKTM